jgi:hypothetical protein
MRRGAETGAPGQPRFDPLDDDSQIDGLDVCASWQDERVPIIMSAARRSTGGRVELGAALCANLSACELVTHQTVLRRPGERTAIMIVNARRAVVGRGTPHYQC